MRTTIRLRDDILKRAKRRAAEEHRSLTSIVEEGVALVLATPPKRRGKARRLPLSSATGGLQPGVDLNRSTDLEGVMEDDA
jgi:hypothetical protein